MHNASCFQASIPITNSLSIHIILDTKDLKKKLINYKYKLY